MSIRDCRVPFLSSARIECEAAAFPQTELCKDFRNLIHPGRVLASEAECNRGTAFCAVAALDFIVSDLARA